MISNGPGEIIFYRGDTKMVKISVTEEDIWRGKRSSYESCPISLAADRALGCRVSTTRNEMIVQGRVHVLAREARNFIDDFDTQRFVSPFEFYIQAQ